MKPIKLLEPNAIVKSSNVWLSFPHGLMSRLPLYLLLNLDAISLKGIIGLSPGSCITGGKVKSSRTRPVVNRAANAFRMAAQALKNSRSALGAFYRRLRSRLGSPKAITATAHKLARIFYSLWTHGGVYIDPGVDYYEQKYQQRLVHHLTKKAQALGFELIPQSASSSSSDSVS